MPKLESIESVDPSEITYEEAMRLYGHRVAKLFQEFNRKKAKDSYKRQSERTTGKSVHEEPGYYQRAAEIRKARLETFKNDGKRNLPNHTETKALPEESPVPEIEFSEISPEIAREILSKTQIKGDAVEGVKLDVENLQDFGLEPKYSTEIEGTKINLSDIYEYDDRLAVVAYVETNDQIVARTFYRSNSQGIWRYLPAYTSNIFETVGWFSKSDFGEDGINAPFYVQRLLAKIDQEQREKNGYLRLRPSDQDLVFAGTAEHLEGDYHSHLPESRDKDLYQETSEKGVLAPGPHYLHDPYPDPESLALPENQEPDYSTPLAEWETGTDVYGKVKVQCFASKDGEIGYMIFQDDKGRAWLAGVECLKAKVNSVGLRSEFVDPGALSTPLYEYHEVSGGYGNLDDRPRGFYHYVSMWDNYISKIPMIKQFLQSKSEQ